MAYVDTNVILARYFPDDELHADSTIFLESTRKKKIVSPVSAAELAAVVSRIEAELQAPTELLQEPPKRRVRALVEFFIKDSGLLMASAPVQARVRLGGTVLLVPIEYHNCIQLAHALRLKTLDLMHLAYADSLRKWGHELDSFVTGDEDILARSDAILEQLGISVKKPSGET